IGAVSESVNFPTLAAPLPSARDSAEHEQLLLSVVLAVPQETDAQDDVTLRRSSVLSLSTSWQNLQGTLHGLNVHTASFTKDSLLLTLPPMESATDQAVLAAQLALLLKKEWPEASIALATGCGGLVGQAAVGAVVEKVARLLH